VDGGPPNVANFVPCAGVTTFFTGIGSGARDGVTRNPDHHDAPESRTWGVVAAGERGLRDRIRETTDMSHYATTEAAAGVQDGAATDLAALRTEIDYLDAEILRLVQRRTAVSQAIGNARRAAGGPRVVHGREMAVLNRYRELGKEGHELAMLLLRLGRGQLGH